VEAPEQIPGTSSVLDGGNKVTGQTAVIWAYGSV
jgi:hypothetical protein